MTITMLNPRIYVASLSDYNDGELVGKWIDAAQDPSDIQYEIDEMLQNSEDESSEEWAIRDYENFEGIDIDENESIEKVSEIALMLEKFGEAFAGYFNTIDSYNISESNFLNTYVGEFSSVEDFGEETYKSLYTIPAFLEPYIDYESVGRDLCSGSYSYVEGGIGIFVYRN